MSIRNYQKTKRNERRIRRIARATQSPVAGSSVQNQALAGFVFASRS